MTYIFLYSANVLLSITLRCIFEFDVIPYYIVDFVIHMFVFLLCMVSCFNKKLNIKINKILNTVPKKVVFVSMSSLVVSSFLISLISSNPMFYEKTAWNYVLRIGLVLLSLTVSFTFPLIIIIVLSNSYLKSQNEAFQKDIEAQAKHYSDLAKANYELRRFKHDFGNMKIGLSQYLKEGDCVGALDMLNSAAIDMQRSSEDIAGFDTGNGIVDAILADKQSRAKTNNTKIFFSGSVPPNSIAPTDLCIIFGNTLDNAIEACEKIFGDTEKIIFVTCKCNSGFVFIDITNPVSEDVVIHGTNVDTSKSDKASHGYGLYSLNKTLKKLDGDVKLSCENKIFKVEIDFSIEQNIIYA